ncbi:MAG: hypothetical protein K0R93_670 [Anaerosolibacter sp.]|jgi:DNA helicase-4|uniref:UvrD-helicase domain-containing protein n=1 Tax=Anaerosolibacter sp. TaxID=1872527 RepID=UPI002601FC45|nr:UvrD-helicase domain-containing protein [Anaerosolibacter sp.]MDF2545772.1 hypothetical protein [Anaerosolibacter sp.]
MITRILNTIDGLNGNKLSSSNKLTYEKINEAIQHAGMLEEYFRGQTKYLDYNFELEHKERIKETLDTFRSIKSDLGFLDYLFDTFCVKGSLNKTVKDNIRFLQNIDIGEKRKLTNKEFIEYQKSKFSYIFNNVENRQLDARQQECIIKDEINNLVVAGAGSGKTTTIVGKVKYLINVLGYSPKDILVISFTNKSANEMKSRIEKSINCNDINAMTFHKLGLEIIKEVEGQQPTITRIDFSRFVHETINELLSKEEYKNKFNKFFIEYLAEYKSQFEFRTLGEYVNYLADKKLQTLDGKRLRSLEEIEIGNFLFKNGIKYEYEKKYPNIQENYNPDFYLSDYDIYIEHFGIDRDGNVPPFFTGKNGKSAKTVYNEGIAWKRNIHIENETTLIETYSYEKFEGDLLDNLKSKLTRHGVELNPKSSTEVFSMIQKENKNELTVFIKLISGFISYMRGNDVTLSSIQERVQKFKFAFQRNRVNLFLELITPIIKKYEDELKERNEIDFSDMINIATRYVDSSKYISPYKYIIIDEYQDISLNRLRLIKGLKNQTGAKLFCVGDDWQSIFKFTGSEVSLFTQFEKHLGYTEISKIEKTFRYNQRIVKISSEFIQKNKVQFKKDVQSISYQKELGKEMDSHGSAGANKKEIERLALQSVLDVKKSVHFIYGSNEYELKDHLQDILRNMPNKANVLLLGRYTFDINEFSGGKMKETGRNGIKFYDRSDLTIEFMTAHSSKGLEADYVIILNNKNGKLGFPSNIEDDSVYNVLRQEEESFPYAEERRLFYVALTRTKNSVYLLINKYEKSIFIKELEKDYGFSDLQHSQESGFVEPNCPTCGAKMKYINTGPYDPFFGCKNYPYCNEKKRIRNKTKNNRMSKN